MKYYIVLVFIVAVFIINNHSIKSCKWIKRKILYKYEKKLIVQHFLNIFRYLNIKYILGFGSELGSYRNDGLIPNDHDVDLLVPLWLNYHIFKCKQYINYTSQNCKIYTHPKYVLCNKTRYDYLMILKEYIVKNLNKNISYRCRKWGNYGYTSCWMLKSRNFFLDIWVLLGNEYVYNNINMCICRFNGIYTYCSENALQNIVNLYGLDYCIPKRKGSGEVIQNCIIYPNKSNSIIQTSKTS